MTQMALKKNGFPLKNGKIPCLHQLRHIVYVFFKIRNPLPNVFVYAVVLEFTE